MATEFASRVRAGVLAKTNVGILGFEREITRAEKADLADLLIQGGCDFVHNTTMLVSAEVSIRPAETS